MRMMEYDRPRATAYAARWAFERNPNYMDFSLLGGDCTSFASQCLYAGSGVMNYTPDTGWYYLSPGRYAPAWSGVKFFNRFLTENRGVGPFGKIVAPEALLPGDFLQLGNELRYYHTLIVLSNEDGDIRIAAHTIDSYDRSVSTYQFTRMRPIHILGVRK
ncbi:MAG: amidase domain-containing protein [Christensenellales bacterium]|jgi:hypothetical protein